VIFSLFLTIPFANAPVYLDETKANGLFGTPAIGIETIALFKQIHESSNVALGLSEIRISFPFWNPVFEI